jgi:hypothetical protein
MAISTKQVDELIAQCEERLARAKQKVIELQAELKGLQVARESISRSRAEPAKSRGASFAWKKILGFLQEKSEQGASIEEVVQFVDRNNLDIQRHAVRSQLSNYNQKGIVSSLGSGEGKYKITPLGITFIGESAQEGDTAD